MILNLATESGTFAVSLPYCSTSELGEIITSDAGPSTLKRTPFESRNSAIPSCKVKYSPTCTGLPSVCSCGESAPQILPTAEARKAIGGLGAWTCCDEARSAIPRCHDH